MNVRKIDPKMLIKKEEKEKEEKKETTSNIIEISDMLEALSDAVIEQLEDTPIVVEPLAYQKMMCMMAVVDTKVEIYGKLIVEVEEFLGYKYPIVKDILIPHQTVSGTSFDSDVKQMAKWMDELNRDKDGNLIPVNEVNNMTKKMLGHFHSHDSVGAISPSTTDTDDMIEHVADRKFWIEIIGNKEKMSGRIALSDPFNMIVPCPVIVKWWGEADNVIREAENKIEKKTYTDVAKGVYTDKPYKTDKAHDDSWYYDDQDYFFRSYKNNKKEDDEDDEDYNYKYDGWGG